MSGTSLARYIIPIWINIFARQWHKRDKGVIAMRKQSLMLLAAATIGLAASQASAADLPRKAPPSAPPPPPPITWTGCYIGANIGGIFGRGDAHFRNFEVGSNER